MKKLTAAIIAVCSTSLSFAGNTNPNTAMSANVGVNKNIVSISFGVAGYSRFEVERSFYSNNFTTIVASQNVMASSANFRINDIASELAGRKMAYYRVKTIADNGTIAYSNITGVFIEPDEGTIITKSTINFTAAHNGNAVITVKNAAGKTVTIKNMIASKGNNIIELTNGLPKGFYTASISVNGVTVDTQKVIAE